MCEELQEGPDEESEEETEYWRTHLTDEELVAIDRLFPPKP